MLRVGGLGLVTLLAAAPSLEAGPASDSQDLAACDAAVRSAPDDFDAYRCYQTYVSATGDRAAAVASLEERVAAQPANLHARTHLGRVLGFSELDRSLTLLREAAESYAEAGDRRSEGWARSFLMRRLTVTRRFDEAAAEADRAVSAAIAADEFPLFAHVRLQQARLAYLQSDEARTWTLMRGLELDERFAGLAPAFRCAVLDLIAVVSGQIELHHTALAYRLRVVALAEEAGLPTWIAQGLSMAAATASRLAARGEMDKQEAIGLAERAALVVRGNRSSLGRTAAWQAQLYLGELIDGEEAIALLQRLAKESADSPESMFYVESTLASRVRELFGPERALPHFERALAAAHAAGSPRNIASALTDLSAVRIAVGPREKAVEQALAGLDAVERLHDSQSGETTGALMLARYAPAYYELIDTLVDPSTHSPTREEIELAFTVGERMRARTLLDQLTRAGVDRPDDATPAAEKRAATLRQISDIQLRLLDRRVKGADRQGLEAELLRLEIEEEQLRAETGRRAGTPADLQPPTVQELQRELREDEALISFLLHPDDGPSWVFGLTATELFTRRLASRSRFEAAARFWIGMLQRGEVTVPGSDRLYRELLADVVDDLPPGIDRLVLVPDGVLHRLPFDALREAPGAPPIVERFEITVTPSAAVWLLLRRDRLPDVDPRALLLADPEFPGAAAWPSPLRSAWWAAGEIGRLPHAREEARRALRMLEGRAELRLDGRASESYLKESASRFRLVHFAAHAIVDAEQPRRSAVLLAPGNSDEDGLLQPREVVDLDLRGTTVILSACRTAGGAEIAGEGVMGLARAFFEARAGSVIGSLWPVRDEDTAKLMDRFYRHLSTGIGPATALAQAKRDLARGGYPAAAWAGFIVLGSGHTPILPATADGVPGTVVAVGLVASAMLALLVALLLRRRRRAV